MSAKQHLQPDGLFPSQRMGFTQVVTAAPGTLVFISGQVAWDADRKLVGEGDLAAQADKALENLGTALSAAGASPADVTMMRVYVVDYQPEHGAIVGPAVGRFYGDNPPAASTWVGVKALAAPQFLIEIEAIAVV